MMMAFGEQLLSAKYSWASLMHMNSNTTNEYYNIGIAGQLYKESEVEIFKFTWQNNSYLGDSQQLSNWT